MADGTLEGVTIRGKLTLAGPSDNITVVGGLTATDAAGTGPGTIQLTGEGDTVNFAGGTTLDAMTFDIRGDSGNRIISPGTLTIGPSAMLGLVFGGAGTVEAAVLVNEGTIETLNLQAAQVLNQGSIGVNGQVWIGQFPPTGTPSGTFFNEGLVSVTGRLDVATLANSGTIDVAAGAMIRLWDAPIAIGAVNAAGATLALEYTLDTAALDRFQIGGATIEIDTVLDNEGSIVNAGSGTSIAALLLEGTLNGGTIHDRGAGFFLEREATLDGVTVLGTLGLEQWTTMDVENGITFAGSSGGGPGVLALAGNDWLNLVGDGTLANVALEVTGPGTIAASGTLTLAANASVIGEAQPYGSDLQIGTGGSLTIVNDGTIAIGPQSSLGFDAATVVNNGTIAAEPGAFIEIQGALIDQGIIGVGVSGPEFIGVSTGSGNVTSGAAAWLNGPVSGSGTIAIGVNSTVDAFASIAPGILTDFLGAAGTLDLFPQNATVTIAGFGGQDQIQITDFEPTGSNFANGILTVSDGTAAPEKLHFLGSYTQSSFSVQTTSPGLTLITFRG